MNEVKENKSSFWNGLGMFIYMGFAWNILSRILERGFSLSVPNTYSITALFTFLTVYPLFISGTENIWTKDKRQWSFLPWAIASVTFSALTYLAGQYFSES